MCYHNTVKSTQVRETGLQITGLKGGGVFSFDFYKCSIDLKTENGLLACFLLYEGQNVLVCLSHQILPQHLS